ncbi:uncharacterized protein [Euphorbia lathyris]|uniref:uncharacterized protein n=1 Tax=Euphorbia lathyris TaxID=212925 RepID=UPI0033142444
MERSHVHTGKEEQISHMASPTNQVKKVTTTHPQIKVAGPAYIKLCPYNGVPVNTAMLENMDDDETMRGLSIRESSDYSCASSVTDGDGFGAKAPGVVVRLMG